MAFRPRIDAFKKIKALEHAAPFRLLCRLHEATGGEIDLARAMSEMAGASLETMGSPPPLTEIPQHSRPF